MTIAPAPLNISTAPSLLCATLTTYISDPFGGNINPGKFNWLKLFTHATAERGKESKITISQDTVSTLISLFRQDSNSFGWVILTNHIEDAADIFHCTLEDSDKVT